MTHDQLKNYIEPYGDRLAIFAFCKKKMLPDANEKRKASLFENLRNKFKLTRKESPESESDSNTIPNKSPKPMRNRNIKLSLMNYDVKKHSYTQIRTSNGGGTRKIKVDQSYVKSDILKEAISVFFPKGKSKLGFLS